MTGSGIKLCPLGMLIKVTAQLLPENQAADRLTPLTTSASELRGTQYPYLL